MKIRNGFVSNSSSSSFIIGYGVIENMPKFKKLLVKEGIELGYCVRISKKGKSETSPCDNEQILCGGNNITLEIPKKLFQTKDLFVVSIHNDEGDQDFWNEDTEELEWEKAEDPDFYNNLKLRGSDGKATQRRLIDMLQDKTLFKEGAVTYGAERNG